MTVDIDRKALCYIGFFIIADDERNLVLICAGEPELLVKALFIVNDLVQLRTFLVFDDDAEFFAAGVLVGDVEDDHVFLRTHVFYFQRIFLYRRGRLGLDGNGGYQEQYSKTKFAQGIDDLLLHIKWVFVTMSIIYDRATDKNGKQPGKPDDANELESNAIR